MTLRDSIRETRYPTLRRDFSKTPMIAAAAKKIITIFEGEGRRLSPTDSEFLIRQIRLALSDGKQEMTSFRDWKSSVWVAFSGEQPLADEPGYLDHLIEQFRRHRKRSAYKALILAYLRDFDPQQMAIRRVAKELVNAIKFYDWAWPARHDQAKLFVPHEAPRHIAAMCIAPGADPFAVLEGLGMGGNLANSGLAAYVYLQFIQYVRENLSGNTPDIRLVDTVLNWSVSGSGLGYPAHRASLANSLLTPWTEHPATEDIKEKIVSFLLQHFKDPRLPVNVKEWIGVSDEALTVIRKWLTGAALEQFFGVIDGVADKQMWRFRSAFWLAYYKADVIDDAWVLFGPEAEIHARQAFGKTLQCGRLKRGSGVQPNHSVLLLRIGKIVIADWSHNGKCQIWLDGNKQAPKLYLPEYTRNAVVMGSDNDGQVHSSSEHGTWQRQVESYIRKHTRVSLSEKEYMPKRWRR